MRMNKKIILSVYYGGLITGVLIVNYVLAHYIEYGDAIIESFRGVDKLNYVIDRELFLYIFFKRVKQIGFVCFTYFQISKLLTLVASDFYFAMIEGMFLSLCTYYYGASAVISGIVMLLPQFFFFFILQLLGWRIYENKNHSVKISRTKHIMFLIILIILVSVAEMLVNSWFWIRFFANK